MKIKEILFDYTNPIDIPTKNLADDANTILDNFKKALHDNVGSPYKKDTESISSLSIPVSNIVFYTTRNQKLVFSLINTRTILLTLQQKSIMTLRYPATIY